MVVEVVRIVTKPYHIYRRYIFDAMLAVGTRDVTRRQWNIRLTLFETQVDVVSCLIQAHRRGLNLRTGKQNWKAGKGMSYQFATLDTLFSADAMIYRNLGV